jgi:hypothetical protein
MSFANSKVFGVTRLRTDYFNIIINEEIKKFSIAVGPSLLVDLSLSI